MLFKAFKKENNFPTFYVPPFAPPDEAFSEHFFGHAPDDIQHRCKGAF